MNYIAYTANNVLALRDWDLWIGIPRLRLPLLGLLFSLGYYVASLREAMITFSVTDSVGCESPYGLNGLDGLKGVNGL